MLPLAVLAQPGPETAALPASPGAVTAPTASTTPVRRELLRDFFDSLSDIALTLNRLTAYRRFGERREVDLAPRTVLSLDELQPSLLSNPAGRPFVTTSAVQALQVDTDHERWSASAAYERGEGTRRVRLGGIWETGLNSSAYVRTNDLRSELAEVPGDPIVGLRRRDVEVGLRWQDTAAAGTRWQAEAGLRHATLDPSAPGFQAPEGSADYLVARGEVASARWSGLSLNAALSQRLRSGSHDPDVDGGRAEAGLQWRLGPGHPLPFLPEGTRVAWREAARLSLLSDDDSLTRRAAYRRNVALEVPDGSPNGATYAHWRQHSLASDDDTEFLLGWRHGWRWPDVWPIETRVEQVWPVNGPNALRATQLGARTWRDQFPYRTITADANTVHTSLANSTYARTQLIQRLADDWLGTVQLSGAHAAPQGEADAATTTQKVAVAVAWRESGARALHLLSRISREHREVEPQYHDASVGERRAWLWMGHASYVIDPESTASLRLARRAVRDQSPGEVPARGSTLWLARWTERVSGTRWSLSGHVAQRRDDVDGQQIGAGVEIGWQLSSRLALALGYNPRGFSDNDLTLDERPQHGVVLRLRFTIESVLGRWLDAGRSSTSASARRGLGDLSRREPTRNAWAADGVEASSPFLF